MILNEEKRKEFDEAAKPMMKWLNDNCHPHVKVVMDCSRVELLEGVCSNITTEFVKD